MISNHDDLCFSEDDIFTFGHHRMKAVRGQSQGRSPSDNLRSLSYHTNIHLAGGTVWMSTLHRRGLRLLVSDCWALNTTFILPLCQSFVKSWCGALQEERHPDALCWKVKYFWVVIVRNCWKRGHNIQAVIVSQTNLRGESDYNLVWSGIIILQVFTARQQQSGKESVKLAQSSLHLIIRWIQPAGVNARNISTFLIISFCLPTPGGSPLSALLKVWIGSVPRPREDADDLGAGLLTCRWLLHRL